MHRLDALFRTGALGMWVLAGFNAVLLVYAWIAFALEQPEYFRESWPTFSRALSSGNAATHRLLAGIAGAGLLAGCLSLAAMRWRLAGGMRREAGLMRLMAALSVLAGALGIVHYFHVAISLSVDNGLHMALSYTFFFGMSFLVLSDLLTRPRLDAALAQPDLAQTPAHRRMGRLLILAALLFLVTYVLKDWPGNPAPDVTQKAFVIMELTWIILAHLYALFYVTPMRLHFRPARLDAPAPLPAWFLPLLFGAALTIACAPAFAGKEGAGTGGTGRIQPAGGVIALTGPQGQRVERVLVQAGQTVKRGALLLVSSDRTARAQEHDLAQERLRGLEQQAAPQRRVAELDVEAAQQGLTRAREDLAQLQGLDERTYAQKDRRGREHAVTAAETALRQANARLDELRQRLEADRRMLRKNLELAATHLAATQLLAPRDASVIEVNAQAGMTLGGGPAIVLADIAKMYVQAEFFEGDLPRIAVGQRVRVSNSALGETLQGTVDQIGRVIDPVNRLAKVSIRLDKPAPADRFIGMQVDVKIDAPGAARPK